MDPTRRIALRFPINRHPRGPPPLMPGVPGQPGEPSEPTGSARPPSSTPLAAGSIVDTSYQPAILDVLVTKVMLHKALRLPVEIVDRVVDFAEYWPHTSTSVCPKDGGGGGPISHQQHPASGTAMQDENRFLLRTPPLGFPRVPHADPLHYTTELPKPLRLAVEHSLEEIQEMTGATADPPLEHCARKIVFTITSRDQGWGGGRGDDPHNPYNDSWTWFDAGLEKMDARGNCGDHCPDHPDAPSAWPSGAAPRTKLHVSPCALRTIRPEVLVESEDRMRIDHPLLPDPKVVQFNQIKDRRLLKHVVVWRADDDVSPDSLEAGELAKKGRGKGSADGEFVRNLRLGDVVTLWAKHRFPGWMNYVDEAQVDVYWAV